MYALKITLVAKVSLKTRKADTNPLQKGIGRVNTNNI